MLSKKARIKITNITDSYSFEQYKADNKQFVPLYTIDKEGKLHVITDKFDGTVPRDRKLISLVVDDEVQPKPVDVTPKQEQARMVADANFESSSKAPEKRKEKELGGDNLQKPAPEAPTNTAQNTEQSVASAPNANSAIDKSNTATVAADDKAVAPKTEATNTANTGVMSANSTATSKTKTPSNSNTNGNGNAPKNKKGALDPNRLPDSGQDSATHSIAKTDTDASGAAEKEAKQSKLNDKNSDK